MTELNLATLDEIRDELGKRFQQVAILVEGDQDNRGNSFVQYRTHGSHMAILGMCHFVHQSITLAILQNAAGKADDHC